MDQATSWPATLTSASAQTASNTQSYEPGCNLSPAPWMAFKLGLSMIFNDQGSSYGNNAQELAHILFPVLPGRMGFLERWTPAFASPA